MGSHIARSPAAIDSSASIGRCHACATTSSPTSVISEPSTNAAAKNRASNRRSRVGGVTHRERGTRTSVRRRRSSASAIAGNDPGSPIRRRRAASSSGTDHRSPRAGSARSTPTSSNASRIAATLAARASTGGRSPPSPTAASSADTTERACSRGSASAASTRPPGNTCTSGANAIVVGRWVSSASRPAGPGRSSTTVAAGRGADTPPSYGRAPDDGEAAPATPDKPLRARDCTEIVRFGVDDASPRARTPFQEGDRSDGHARIGSKSTPDATKSSHSLEEKEGGGPTG